MPELLILQLEYQWRCEDGRDKGLVRETWNGQQWTDTREQRIHKDVPSVISTTNMQRVTLTSRTKYPLESLLIRTSIFVFHEHVEISAKMEALLQNMVFSLHVDETFDYDRHVRDHPFVIPSAVQSAQLERLDLDIGHRICHEEYIAYEEFVVIQAAYHAWYRRFQPQFTALMRSFAQKDIPDEALRKIIEYLEKLEQPPIFLSEIDGWTFCIECYFGWAYWPEQAIETYKLIADWILNLPFPQVPWESREEERKDRAELWQKIRQYMPGALCDADIEKEAKILAKKPKVLDAAQTLVEQMSMVKLK